MREMRNKRNEGKEKYDLLVVDHSEMFQSISSHILTVVYDQ